MANERIEQIRELAIRQLESLRDIAGEDIKGTRLELDLQMAISSLSTTPSPIKELIAEKDDFDTEDEYSYEDDYEDENYEDDEDYVDGYENNEEYVPVVPNNFPDEEAYQDFLRSQEEVLPVVTDEETGETTTLRPDDVAGVIETENGFVEVGSLDESLNTADEILREQNTIRDEEGEELYQNEIDEVPEIRVAVTRTDENVLTSDQVNYVILTHPSSRTMLHTFGNDYRVTDGSDPSEKIIRFRIDNTDDRARKASQGLHFSNGVVQFAGHLTFPGIGRVYARALVD